MLNKLEKQFFAPLLQEDTDKLTQCRKGIVLKNGTRYFDFTASGLAFQPILKRIQGFLPYYANTHSDSASHAIITTKLCEIARERIKNFLGLQEDFLLLCAGSGSTSAIKMFQELMGIYIPPKTMQILNIQKDKLPNLPKVFVGPYEHHSNEISLREGLCQVTRIPLNDEGLINLEALKQELQEAKGQIIGSFNVASNVTGLLSPLSEISKILREKKAIVAFDMASSSPYMNVDSSLFDACFLSPHKLLGGVGSCGLLGIREKLIDPSLPPTFAGGGTIKNSNRLIHQFLEDLTQRQEAGTPPIIQLLTASLAYQLRNEVGLEWIERREKMLIQTMRYELQSIPAITLYGNESAKRLGVISFNVGGVSPYDLSNVLSHQYGIQTRSGCSCAGPYGCDLFGLDDELKNKPTWIRMSLHYTHNLEDLEYFVESLKKAIKKLRG